MRKITIDGIGFELGEYYKGNQRVEIQDSSGSTVVVQAKVLVDILKLIGWVK